MMHHRHRPVDRPIFIVGDVFTYFEPPPVEFVPEQNTQFLNEADPTLAVVPELPVVIDFPPGARILRPAPPIVSPQ